MREDLPPLGSGQPAATLAVLRRRLAGEIAGIAVSIVAFGLVFGVSARLAGFSVIEAAAFSSIVFAGSSQFAAIGALAGGASWAGIILLTALLNARHLLYSAVLAPWLAGRPRPERALMAHVLTDEAFALSVVHFRRFGRADIPGYWAAALASTFIPWNLATLAGYAAAGVVPDPARLGLDVVFPAAMAGLAVGLVTGRRDAVAAAGGASIGVAAGLVAGPAVGILLGGLIGPLAGLAAPSRAGGGSS